MRALLTAMIAIALAACVTSKKLNRVEVGMTKAQVIQVMGKPFATSAKDGIEYMRYNLYTRIEPFAQTSEHFVRIVDGRVDAFGQAGDFDSTPNRPLKVEQDITVRHH